MRRVKASDRNKTRINLQDFFAKFRKSCGGIWSSTELLYQNKSYISVYWRFCVFLIIIGNLSNNFAKYKQIKNNNNNNNKRKRSKR